MGRRLGAGGISKPVATGMRRKVIHHHKPSRLASSALSASPTRYVEPRAQKNGAPNSHPSGTRLNEISSMPSPRIHHRLLMGILSRGFRARSGRRAVAGVRRRENRAAPPMLRD